MPMLPHLVKSNLIRTYSYLTMHVFSQQSITIHIKSQIITHLGMQQQQNCTKLQDHT